MQNKWIPRRSDTNPKTIDQIPQELAQEAEDGAFKAQQALARQMGSQKTGGKCKLKLSP